MESSNEQFVKISCKKSSCDLSFEDSNDCDTQDACDYELDIESVSNSSLYDANHDSCDKRPNLTLNTTNYFKDFGAPVAVLSPISELAMNVAATNLFATSSRLIKGKCCVFKNVTPNCLC